mmetsp:Transcript_35568/g.92995  ORF Transcript_35568/g.92995 Transcript_35568/m.92995 type:complete len:287 (-) Transcript_35568:9-869(-)
MTTTSRTGLGTQGCNWVISFLAVAACIAGKRGSASALPGSPVAAAAVRAAALGRERRWMRRCDRETPAVRSTPVVRRKSSACLLTSLGMQAARQSTTLGEDTFDMEIVSWQQSRDPGKPVKPQPRAKGVSIVRTMRDGLETTFFVSLAARLRRPLLLLSWCQNRHTLGVVLRLDAGRLPICKKRQLGSGQRQVCQGEIHRQRRGHEAILCCPNGVRRLPHTVENCGCGAWDSVKFGLEAWRSGLPNPAGKSALGVASAALAAALSATERLCSGSRIWSIACVGGIS